MDDESISFEELYTTYYSAILRYLVHRLTDRQQAEDATPETFYRAYRAWERFLATTPVERHRFVAPSWLYRIATNLSIDLLRRRQLITYCELDAQAEEACSYDDPFTVVTKREEASSALAHLRDRERKALLAYYGHDATYAEISEMLGIKESGVKMFLHRARIHARQHPREKVL